jgi:tRNA threonylcarbamoyladenosine biosynthesis protein TsaE
MGAGKSTFARALIQALGVKQPAEGSPSFAIAHEYSRGDLSVVHIDFYRLRSQGEIDDAGIPAYFWERDAVVLSEWTSLFPDFLGRVEEAEGRSIWRVSLDFVEADDSARSVRIERLR